MKSQSSNIIVLQDAMFPFRSCQFTGSDGVRRKKTTKVPIAGGMFQGEKLTRNQAKNRALIIAHQMAEAKSHEYAEKDNRSTREIFDLMMSGKLGRVSTATYNNAQTSYKHFLKWLGKRADTPMRLITKADIKEWGYTGGTRCALPHAAKTSQPFAQRSHGSRMRKSSHAPPATQSE